VRQQRRPLADQRIGAVGEEPGKATLMLHPWQTVGLAGGRWCPYGVTPDQARDQREEEGGQLIFDSEPLDEDIEIFGFPVLELRIASDRPNALIAATLCEIMQDGAVSRVTYGILNLTHREGHEDLKHLEPGVPVSVRLQLNGIAHRFAAGNRIRVGLSTSYWPIVWPSPEAVVLAVDLESSSLVLPVRPARAEDAVLEDFAPAEHALPSRQSILEPEMRSWTVCQDVYTGITIVRRIENDGVRRYEDHGLETGEWRESVYKIKPDDPLSAEADIASKRQYSRGNWKVWSASRIIMTSSATHFQVRATLDAYEQDERVIARSFDLKIPRDHV